MKFTFNGKTCEVGRCNLSQSLNTLHVAELLGLKHVRLGDICRVFDTRGGYRVFDPWVEGGDLYTLVNLVDNTDDLLQQLEAYRVSGAASQDDDTEINARGGQQSKITQRCTLLPPKALLRVAECMTAGSIKYGDDNWRKIETKSHLDHAQRHILLYLSGDTSENHLVNATTRMLMALEMSEQ